MALILSPLVSALNISTPSYSVNSTHLGTSGTWNISSVNYIARDTITYQQAGTRNLQTISYIANSGWFSFLIRLFSPVNDTTAPIFVLTTATPVAVINGSNITINADVNDNVQVDSVWANITLPDNTSYFISAGSLPYIYTTDVSQIGTHIVTFYANDSSGNNATAIKTFITAPPVNLTINVEVIVGVFSNIDLIIYLRGTTDEIGKIENLNGTKSILLPDVPIDLFFNITFDNKGRATRINNFNLSESTGGVISFSDPTVPGYLTVYAINTSFIFDNASIEISYDNLGYTDKDDLELHKCDNFDIVNGVCLSGFNDITIRATQDKDNDKFIYSTTSFSGFGIKEYVAPVGGDTDGGGAVSGSGGGCGSGYELIDGKCVKIEEAPEQLFDITFNLNDKLIQATNELSGVITFERFGVVPTPVNLTFIILDESGNEIYREESEITVEVEELLRWDYEGLQELPEGKYIAVLETFYGDDVYDKFTQEFEIGEEKRGITGRAIDWVAGGGKWYSLSAIGILIIILILWLIIIDKKQTKKKPQRSFIKRDVKSEIREIKRD